jgi:hypothetical protein
MRTRPRGVDELDATLRALNEKGGEVFHVSSNFPEDRVIYWNGDRLEDYIRLAKDLGGGVLYVRNEEVEEGDEELPGHVGELWIVEAAFLRDGIFHVFRRVAPWADDVLAAAEEAKEEGEAKLVETIRKNAAKIVGELLEQLSDDTKSIEPEGWELRRRITEFLRARGDLPPEFDTLSLRRAHPHLDLAIDKLIQQVGTALRAKERKMLESLVPQCAEWGRRNMLKTLNLADVEVFLAEENVQLSKGSRRVLWQKTNFALKTSRIPS